MDNKAFREAVRKALQALNASTENAIRRELATTFDWGHTGRLPFEINPHDYRIHLTQTEEAVLNEFSVDDAIPQHVHDAAERNDYAESVLFVSPQGNDAWSGRIAIPADDGTDGPLATLPRAVRLSRRQAARGPRRIVLQAGQYHAEDYWGARRGRDRSPPCGTCGGWKIEARP